MFGHEVTREEIVPTAAEAKALSEAHQLLKVGSERAARETLFKTFSPAVAEAHITQIKGRLGIPQKAPVLQRVPQPMPHQRIPPSLKIVRTVLVVTLIIAAFAALRG